MTYCIFTETHNRKGKRDGQEFRLQATGLHNVWQGIFDDGIFHGTIESANKVHMHRLTDQKPKQKKQFIYDTLEQINDLERMAFFCHGTPKGLSLGFKLGDVPRLAASIAAACKSNVVYIGLYACLTGRGNFWGGRTNKKNTQDRKEKVVTKREGFAMLLCKELDDLGIHAVITAHTTSGHTTYNPYKVRIERAGDYITRTRMCKSDDPFVWRKWVKELTNDLTFRYDIMTDDWKCHG